MSKQSEAKKSQGYDHAPVLHVCRNCNHSRPEFEEYESFSRGVLKIEKGRRCVIGGFAVNKLGTCNLYERAE